MPTGLPEDTSELKRAAQQVKVKYLQAVRESERLERMLKAQGSINRDLTSEVEDMQAKLREDRTALQAKADDW